MKPKPDHLQTGNRRLDRNFSELGLTVPFAGDIVLRPMVAADLLEVVAIETQSQRDPWTLQGFAAELENVRVSQPLVAVRDGEIVGYLVAWFIADEVQIVNIAVKEDHRRQGMARFMLSCVLQSALRRGCRMAFLEVRKSNLAARRLYQSLGFAADGLRPHYYSRGREDAILMKNGLAPQNYS